MTTTQLEPGDRVLFFTDGIVEERLEHGVQFGEARLRLLVEQTSVEQVSVSETVRLLSHTLMDARGGRTSDDASLLMVEWRGRGTTIWPAGWTAPGDIDSQPSRRP